MLTSIDPEAHIVNAALTREEKPRQSAHRAPGPHSHRHTALSCLLAARKPWAPEAHRERRASVGDTGQQRHSATPLAGASKIEGRGDGRVPRGCPLFASLTPRRVPTSARHRAQKARPHVYYVSPRRAVRYPDRRQLAPQTDVGTEAITCQRGACRLIFVEPLVPLKSGAVAALWARGGGA
jgi:hypothetical protein